MKTAAFAVLSVFSSELHFVTDATRRATFQPGTDSNSTAVCPPYMVKIGQRANKTVESPREALWIAAATPFHYPQVRRPEFLAPKARPHCSLWQRHRSLGANGLALKARYKPHVGLCDGPTAQVGLAKAKKSYGVAIGYNAAGPLALISLRAPFEKMWVIERAARTPNRFEPCSRTHISPLTSDATIFALARVGYTGARGTLGKCVQTSGRRLTAIKLSLEALVTRARSQAPAWECSIPGGSSLLPDLQKHSAPERSGRLEPPRQGRSQAGAWERDREFLNLMAVGRRLHLLANG